MNKAIQRMLVAILLFCGLVSVQAQIPADVAEVIRKTNAKMTNTAGLEIDMNIHLGMLIFKGNMETKLWSKGEKSLMKGKMKMLGQVTKMEEGFDGTQQWVYESFELSEDVKEKARKKGKKLELKDSLKITKTSAKQKTDNTITFDFDKDYRKATMKLKDKYYVITFSNPVDKEDPKKMTVRIDKDNFYVREMSARKGGVKMTVTINRVKVGVSDDVFKLDISKYPGAVVVRK